MKTTLFAAAVLLSLANLSLPVHAGTKITTASFQVSLTISEACAIESGATRPVVNCQYNTPYQLLAAVPAVATASAARSAQYTPATGDAPQVWTVTF